MELDVRGHVGESPYGGVMERRIGDVMVNYVEHGDGMPLIALHGAGVDHRELEEALEAAVEAAVEAQGPWSGVRRIYVDLPGMGLSTADGLSSNAEVVGLLAAFLGEVAGGPALVLGHSYGAYLARGLVAQHPDAVAGLALLCPIGEGSGSLPAHRAVRTEASAYDELPAALRDGFDEYFVVRTAETARRYLERTVPGIALVDQEALERVFGGWELDLSGSAYTGPTLIVAGRDDAIAGYASAVELVETYPHSTLAVVDGAGHALMHERPEVLGALLAEWLQRLGLS
jgi:pimeloyl-ACP methyl ester carboxylesterase